MDIFSQAMELEREGEALYRQFSLEAPEKGMKNIFGWLADQEKKHYEIFQKMKAGQPAKVAESTLLRDVKDIFDGWRTHETCINAKTPQSEIYGRALAVEIQSITVYEKYAATAPAPQKEIFLKIAAEEKGHKRIIENIIEFITKPEAWAENAEFSHLSDDYYL